MKAGKRYYLQQYSLTEYWHGGVGYTHVEELLEKAGFRPLVFPANGYLARVLALLRWLFRLQPGDQLALIYPVYPRLYRWLLRLITGRGIELVVVVGDIDGLKDEDAAQLESDIRFFKEQTRVLVHNQAMANWMRSIGSKARIECLELFPFLTAPVVGPVTSENVVVFAGNLGKSGFVLELGQPQLAGLKFHLYGEGLPISAALPENVKWKGRFPPASMPERVEGRFGLLWDGDSWASPSGPIGHYMAYISHHKLSLYVLAGLPILAPRVAGSASFIEREKIGILFDSLADLETEIKKLSEESFNEMRSNLLNLAKQLSDGSYFLLALRRLLAD